MRNRRLLGRYGSGLVAVFLPSVTGAVTPTGAVAQAVAEVFRDCEVCPEMVVVPAGSFMMGSDSTEEGSGGSEQPRHRVTIGYVLAVGVYEVTFAEWSACVRGGGCGGHEPNDEGWGRENRPVINVHWEDAWRYADWLTERTGEEYRLPSNAEWEYAARARTTTARHWGDTAQDQCRYANGYDFSAQALDESDESIRSPVRCRDRQPNTAPVGSYLPNGSGLYDMLGNVWEWVDDCWNSGYDGAPTDGSSWYPGDCSRRVLRGGSWSSGQRDLRSARHAWGGVATRNNMFGFRVVRRVR